MYNKLKRLFYIYFNPKENIKEYKKTIVLDLDETLIHSIKLEKDYLNNTTLEYKLFKLNNLTYKVYKRPFLDLFLKRISEWYTIVIYTASTFEYANPIINWIDKDNLITKRYFRESCILKNGNYLKDLSLIDKDLNKVFLIDNSSIAFDLFKENGILINTWTSNSKDESLLFLLPFLDCLRFTNNVRNILKLQYSQKKLNKIN